MSILAQNATDRIAIIVPSCDKYSDLWTAFFFNFNLRWSSCPFHVYLITNYAEFVSGNVTTIKVGKDLTWSANLITALSDVPFDYVFLFIDDLFLSSNVDERRVLELIDRCISNEWDYLRFNPTPGPLRSQMVGTGVGRILPGDWYRSSTVLTVWKKQVLLEVLDPKENAWEFEIFGAWRTDKFINWYACKNWTLPYYNLVIKGKIDPVVLEKLSLMCVQIDTCRPVMSVVEMTFYRLRKVRSALMNLIPRTTRRKLRDLFRAA